MNESDLKNGVSVANHCCHLFIPYPPHTPLCFASFNGIYIYIYKVHLRQCDIYLLKVDVLSGLSKSVCLNKYKLICIDKSLIMSRVL